MVYFCFQVYFNFVCKRFTNISTPAHAKGFENMSLNKGNEVPVVNSDANWTGSNRDKKIGNLFLITLF